MKAQKLNEHNATGQALEAEYKIWRYIFLALFIASFLATIGLLFSHNNIIAAPFAMFSIVFFIAWVDWGKK